MKIGARSKDMKLKITKVVNKIRLINKTRIICREMEIKIDVEDNKIDKKRSKKKKRKKITDIYCLNYLEKELSIKILGEDRKIELLMHLNAELTIENETLKTSLNDMNYKMKELTEKYISTFDELLKSCLPLLAMIILGILICFQNNLNPHKLKCIIILTY